MATTRADLFTLFKRLNSAVNSGSASAFTTVLDDPRRSYGEIFAALQAADDEVCEMCATPEGHHYRPLFMQDSDDLTHGATLPDRLGPVSNVRIKHVAADSDYKAGKFDKDLSLADIEHWRDNAGGLYGANHDAADSSLSGFALVLGDEVYFTGYRAKVKYASYTRTSRDVTDGAMTSGSKNLTSATAAFTANDAGGAAMVEGAGASGVVLVSRIDTYTNSTTVVLRDANASGGGITGKNVTIAKLQSPQAYENGLLVIAGAMLFKKGDNNLFIELCAKQVDGYRQRIRGNERTLPALEMAQAA